MPNSKVAIAMSTYNGERYLREQLDSLLAQSVPVEIYVRDDGSSDATARILKEYEGHYHNVHVFLEDNKGCTRSFLRLLSAIPNCYEYYAFCDQDDRWHADKIEKALAILEKESKNIPLLYCSEYNYCGEDMSFQSASHLNKIGVSFSKCFFENVCSGNTMVFNEATRSMVIRANPSMVYCHDWWVALVVTCFGKLYFDEAPTLNYRRTGSNVSPTGLSSFAILKYRINTFFRDGQLRLVSQQLKYFLELYSQDVPKENKGLLNRCVYGGRFVKASTPRRFRQKPLDEIVVRLLLCLGQL